MAWRRWVVRRWCSAATGEVANDRELGGTEMHASVSGVVEYLVEDDAHGLLKAREVFDRLGLEPPRITGAATRAYQPPQYPAEQLAGAVPTDPKVPYDCREVLARVVDGSDIEEFKPRYGASTLCASRQYHRHCLRGDWQQRPDRSQRCDQGRAVCSAV